MDLIAASQALAVLILGYLAGRSHAPEALLAEEDKEQPSPPPQDEQRSPDYCWTHNKIEDRSER